MDQMHQGCLNHARRLTQPAPGRASACLATLAALMLVTACSSGNSSSTPASSSLLVPQMKIAKVTAIPPDVPSAPPPCPADANVAQQLQTNLVSACVNQTDNEAVIFNLTDFVLDVSSANTTTTSIQPYNGSSPEPLPSTDAIEVDAQNSVVADLRPPADAVLLPVGGSVVVSGTPPSVTVKVDGYASGVSYFAQLMTGYVVDNLIEALPEDSAAAYAVSISECVNAADNLLYEAFKQQPPPGATDLMQAALQTIAECQNLKRKLTADHDEQIAAIDKENRDDLSAVANAAGQEEWESKFEEDDTAHGIDIR
jgi:hypothetical protein